MQSNRDIEKIIINNEAILRQAVIDIDVPLLDKLLDESFTFTIRDEKLTKETYLNEYKRKQNTVHSLKVYLQVFRQVTKEVVVIERWTYLTGIYLGKKIAGKYRYIHRWKLINDEYKLISGSINPEDEARIPNDFV